MPLPKKKQLDDAAGLSNEDRTLFMKFEAPSFDDGGDVEMVPIALFGGWQFPWNRSTNNQEQRPSNESLLVSFFFILCRVV